jgi:hypothetical protein
LIAIPAYLDVTTNRGGPSMMGLPIGIAYLELATDPGAPVVGDVWAEYDYSSPTTQTFYFSPSLTVQPASNLRISIAPTLTIERNADQWVCGPCSDPAACSCAGRTVLAQLDQSQISADIRVDWALTPRLTFQLYLQPLLSVGRYGDFHELAKPGTRSFDFYGRSAGTIGLQSGVYNVDPDGAGPGPGFTFDNPDFNTKSMRASAVLRWEYLPGATIYAVWTLTQTDSSYAGDMQLGRDLTALVHGTYEQAVMIKATYWWSR